MRGPTDPQRGGRHRWPAPIGGRPPKIAPRGGRLQIGTVADIKSVSLAGFRRNPHPVSIAIDPADFVARDMPQIE
jgi:hypothetical protein